MVLGITRNAFVILVLGIFFVGDPCAQDTAKLVEVNGDRVSVQADGIPLGELLAAVEDLTGIYFRFDELMAKKETFLDFKDLPLSEGIKKMVFPLNCAMIYDDTDRLRRVVILGNWVDSGTIATREGDNGHPESLQSNQPDTAFPARKRRSDVSAPSKMPSAKGPVRYEGPPARSADPMEGPPLNKPYLIDGPPIQQDQVANGPADAADPDHLSPSQSGNDPVDGPPSNRPYLVDGPPDSKEYEMEAPP